MPKVSIFSAAYRVEPYIARMIESVQAQTLQDWELIIVDDCSPDGTVQVIEKYLDDPRIKLLRNEQNQGAGYSRNRAIAEARGEWLAMLDADDWFAPHRLERLISIAEAMNTEMVADLQVFMPEGSDQPTDMRWAMFAPPPAEPTIVSAEEAIRAHIFIKPIIRMDYVRKIGLRFLPELKGWYDDYVFFVEPLVRGARLVVVPEGLYYYRVHESSLTKIYRRDVKKAIEKVNIAYNYLKNIAGTSENCRLLRILNKMHDKIISDVFYLSFINSIKESRFIQAILLLIIYPKVSINLINRIINKVFRNKQTESVRSGGNYP